MRDFHLPGRSLAIAGQGMAATSHPHATLTAIDVLRAGGNAIDAAVAASAVQAVVEPQSTGIGGDCWALYAKGGRLPVYALNSSGWSPQNLTSESLRRNGSKSIGQHTPHAVTVPGAIAGWAALLEQFGTRNLSQVLEPAIQFAENGFAVTPRVAFDWEKASSTLLSNEEAKQVALPKGTAPRAGSIIAFPKLAKTLRTISEDGWQSFYQGSIANAMLSSLQQLGGTHEMADFAQFAPEWCEPVFSEYHGLRVYECPPNGQGVVALQIMNLLEALDIGQYDPSGYERYHLEAEATRLAFRDRDLALADPRMEPVPIKKWLDKNYAADLGRAVSMDFAMPALPPSGLASKQNTIYLCVADRDRNIVSFINSTYDSFGSGIFCPSTGVNFQSRGRAFSLKPGHLNELKPRKRPMHTIIPAMAAREENIISAFGVMGGDYQPVGQAHVFFDRFLFGRDAQAALSSPRLMAYPGPAEAERGLAPEIISKLRELGHQIKIAATPVGGGQMIELDGEIFKGGSDHRKDGMALGY